MYERLPSRPPNNFIVHWQTLIHQNVELIATKDVYHIVEVQSVAYVANNIIPYKKKMRQTLTRDPDTIHHIACQVPSRRRIDY